MALCQIEGKEGAQGGDDFEATMIGWFANAIMVGYDTANNGAADRIEALTEQLKTCRMAQVVMDNTVAELERERDRWREIANNEAVEGEANRNAGLTLEAKLARAVEGLEEIASYDDGPYAGVAYTAKLYLDELKEKK
jgi:hypothetical protein